MNRNLHVINPGVYFSLTILLGTTMACSDNSKKTKSTPPVSAEYKGVWDQSGYGNLMSITDKGATLYQYTRKTCLKAQTYTNAEITEILAETTLSEDKQTVTIVSENRPLLTSKANKLSTLPNVCLPENLILAKTPIATFDHLWHTFNDYYAFFKERNIDWGEYYSEVRPTVTDEMTDEALLEAFRKLLSPLNDGHIRLLTRDGDFNFAKQSAAITYLMETFAEQTEFDDIEEYIDSLSAQVVEIQSRYFDLEAGGSEGGSNGRAVRWGSNKNVGYLDITRMAGFAGDDDETVDKNVEVVKGILNSAMSDLSGTDALIIDVRFNGGGYDEVSLAIASYFTDQSTLAFTKKTRSYAGDTNTIDAFFSRVTESPYLKPIAILISPNTASAAEVFLTAMSSLPHVTIVGEKTVGILADQLDKDLPNGWVVAVPNVVFMDKNGTSFEVTGVPPDVEVITDLPDLFGRRRDKVIEKAITVLGY